MVTPSLIKDTRHEISLPLKIVTYKSNTGTVPGSIKAANVKPIHEVDEKEPLNNYIPIYQLATI
jgi:hypothetical protein